MSKQLRIWLFVLIGTLLASSSLLAEGVITMTTTKKVGATIELTIEANGNVTIEGAQDTGEKDYLGRSKYYKIKSQTIIIRGNVTSLYCPYNQLTSLDVSSCTALTRLDCYWNQLTSLDLSGCTALTTLTCYGNQLTSLNVSGCTALTTLTCYGNQLTSLNVSGCTALTTLYCSDNQLTGLDISKNASLEILSCGNNQLTSLNVSKNKALTKLKCEGFSSIIKTLTSLNASGCTALTELDCRWNQLTSLDISGCTSLKILDCWVNSLTNLDVSDCVSLTELDCGYNRLTSLDLSHSSALIELNCYDNALTSLDLSKCLKLRYVDCSENQINGEAMSRLVASLPTCSDDYHGQYSRYNSYPGGYFVAVSSSNNDEWNLCSKENVASARTKNWTSLKKKDGSKYHDLELVPYEGVDLNQPVGHGVITMTTGRPVGEPITLLFRANGGVALEGVKEMLQSDGSTTYQILPGQTITIRGDVTALSCRDSELTSLRVSGCPSLTWLDCGENKLTSLDVSQNRALQKLLCHKNRLISLDVSQNSALTKLACSSNRLTSLDLSQNSALEQFGCDNNQLTSLDVSQNTALKLLYCFGNQLTRLDISHNNELIELSCYYNQIKGAEMTKLVNSLPERSGHAKFYVVAKDSLEGNVCLKSDVAIVAEKGWTPLGYNRSTKEWEYYGGRETDSFGVSLTHEGEGSIAARGADDLDAVPYGTELTIVATPKQGYELTALTANDKDILATRKVVVTENTTIKATFAKETFVVTLDKEGEGVLDATGADNLKAVPYGTKLTIIATPAEGYELKALLAGGFDIRSTKSVEVTGDTRIKAIFTQQTFAVTLPSCEHGKVKIVEPVDLKAVPYGTTLTISATPETGYELTALTANGEDILATKSFVVKGATEIRATFSMAHFAVTLTHEGEGKVDATGAEDLTAVPYGTELTINATPAAGYELTALTANGEDILPTKKVVVTDNMTIKATFSNRTFAVTLTKEGEGTITATGAGNLNAVAYGTELTINATPAEGYELVSLEANGVDITATKKVVVTGNLTVKATFAKKTFAVTLTKVGDGTITATGASNLNAVAYGTELTVVATPAAGYELVSLEANGVDITATKKVIVTDNMTIKATFTQKARNYAVTFSKTGEGYLDATGADDLSAVPYGTELTIEATPATGYELTALTANGRDILSTKRFVVKGDTEVKATFTQKARNYAVTFTQTGEGRVTATGADDLNAVPYGTELTITATPAEGYELTTLTANGEDILSTQRFVVKGDTEVKATFAQKTLAVTLTHEGEGSLTATGYDKLSAVPYGTELTIVAQPKQGYELTALMANGRDILATRKVVVTENLTVKATFAQKTFAVTLTQEGEGVLNATGADDLKAVPYGTKLTITATPATGYELVALMANGLDILSTKSVEVTGDTRIKAIFRKKTFAVTLSSNEHGTISIVEPVDLDVVAYGTTLTVKATGKNAQCVLTALTANGEDILATKSFVVKGATEVKATFVDHTGVETTVTQQTQLYPNPATDYVIVEGVAPASEVTLHSMTGERLYAGRADSRGTLRIDLTPYADGVYLVCVADETYRVVVRH